MKLVKWFAGLKFEIKMFLCTFLLVMVLLLSVLLYFYSFVFSTEVDKAVKNLDTLAGKMGEQMGSVVNDMDHTALQLAATPYVMQVLSGIPPHTEDNYFTREPIYSNEIIQYLNTFNIKKDMVARICLYNDRGDFISSGHRPASARAVSDYFKAKEAGGAALVHDFFAGDSTSFMLYIPPRDDPFNDSTTQNDDQQLFSVVRKIQNYAIMDSDTAWGYVEVQQPMDRFTELFASLDSQTIGIILKGDGSVLYCTDPDISPALASQVVSYAERQSQEGRIQDGNSTWLTSLVTFSEFPGQLVLLQDQATVFSGINSVWLVFLLSMLVVLIFIGVTEYVIVRRLTKPLHKLHRSINSVSINHLEWEIQPGEDGDEFSKLNQAFEQLFDKLQDSVDALVAARTSELKSHLKALQAQMDPHFMHNILTIINVMAKEENYAQIMEVSDKLAEILRYSASYKDVEVPLHREVANAVNYMDLMKIRYEHHFNYTVEHNPEVEDFSVPKLILQPLVENCFKHGFSKKAPPWQIDIKVLGDARRWAIQIDDNGTGFREKEQAQFRQDIRQFDGERFERKIDDLEIGRLGLINIYIRLRLTYGENMRFTIESTEAGGTSIIIGGTTL